MVLAVLVRLAALANKFESTNLSMPSVIVGIIWNPAERKAASGVAIGTLGFAGAYKSDIFRLCVLYIYGGVWTDISSICNYPIDKIIFEKNKGVSDIR